MMKQNKCSHQFCSPAGRLWSWTTGLLFFCLGLVVLSPHLAANTDTDSASRAVIETKQHAPDGSFLSVQFPLTENTAAGAEFLRQYLADPKSERKVKVFVPASMEQADKEDYVETVRSQVTALLAPPDKPHFAIELVEIDTKHAAEQARQGNSSIDRATEQLESRQKDARALATAMKGQNNRILSQLFKWKEGLMARVRHSTDQQKDMLAGTVFGFLRSGQGAVYWIQTTGANIYGLAQVGITMAFEVLLARYAHIFEKWKAQHEVPFAQNNPIVRFYNDFYTVKAFVINTMVGASLGLLFRLTSWLHNPMMVIPPWVLGSILAYFGTFSMKGLSDTVGSQGAMTWRRKGYISGRFEYYIYQLFGFLNQVERFALGMNRMVFFSTIVFANTTTRLMLFASSRIVRPKGRSWLVIHPLIPIEELESILHVEGHLDRQEVEDISHLERDYADLFENPRLRDLTFGSYQRVRQVLASIRSQTGSALLRCSNLLNK